MKNKLGYSLTFLMLCLFILTLIQVADEKRKILRFDQWLDKNLEVQSMQLNQTSYITDKDDALITEINTSVKRKSLQSDEIPDFLKQLFILSEDQHFYEHIGFDIPSIGRAFLTNIDSDEIEQGASTITQQLARNMFQSYDKTYNRKLRELLYAYQLERKQAKEEILTQYVNAIYFANDMYGIERAANYYFSQQTSKLTKAQLAFLASIPNNPSIYNPLKHFDQTKKRQERLIDLLVQKEKISTKEGKQLKREKISLKLQNSVDLYPDYTTYVQEEFKQLIADKKGYSVKLERASKEEKQKLNKQLEEEIEQLYAKGITLHTSLDQKEQKNAKKTVNNLLPYKDVEGTAVVINQKTHQVIALVGGKNYKKYDFNRSYQAFRQPGSAIKPLLVYAPYLEETNSPLTSKVNANSYCNRTYCPKNYSGKNYGMVTIKNAFIHSYNTPAVRILKQTGVNTAFSYLTPFGFQKITTNDYRLPAAVGGLTYGITPLELTNAYTTFGNNGMFEKARAIVSVTDAEEKQLYKWDNKHEVVWSRQTNDKMRQLLQQTVSSGTAKKAYFPSPYLGGKTGTTNDYKDYWIIGLSETKTVGVWIGKDQPSNLNSIESQAPHLQIWKKIISN
ncbi:MAG: transglycosylase domain-containing protein [Bacillus sp. (in: firmicutes)]